MERIIINPVEKAVPIMPSGEGRTFNVGTKLATDHWSYLKKLLEEHDVSEAEVNLIGFHYKTAFEHGFKHGVEYEETRKDRTSTCSCRH